MPCLTKTMSDAYEVRRTTGLDDNGRHEMLCSQVAFRPFEVVDEIKYV